MSRLIKLSNFFIFFIALLIFLLSKNYTNISNGILAILPQSSNKNILKAYEENSNSKSILIAIKNKGAESRKEFNVIEKELSKIPNISLNTFITPSLFNYQKKYQLYLKRLDNKKLEKIDIEKELKKSYNKILNSFFPVIINETDPLNLFIDKNKEEFLVPNSYLFMSFNIHRNINNLTAYKKLYEQIYKITKNNKELKVFSPIFYFVENSQTIKDDANTIVIFAILTLLILYIIILRNFNLLLNTLASLGSSSLIASFIITSIYNEVSIFVFIFGISISTVAIDYMFHHYMHRYYETKKPFNKEVFFGFLTTSISFFIISFIPFTLITQIAIFATISLTISYLHFAFLYPKIGFRLEDSWRIRSFNTKINKNYLLVISFSLIFISFFLFKFDSNLKNLDYKNIKLEKLEYFFKEQLKYNNKQTVLIEATSIDDLITKYHKVKNFTSNFHSVLDLLIDKEKYLKRNKLLKNKNFEKIKGEINIISTKIGFKKNYFNNSYKIEEKPIYTLQYLQKLGVNTFKYKNKIFTAINIYNKDYPKLKQLQFIKPLSIKLLFEDSMKDIGEKSIYLGLFVLFLIIFSIFFITKKSFLFSLNFLLFPLSTILVYSYFTPFNILHIFMMFIILAISIDYGIYSSKNLDLNTKKAIFYSLLSTFAGFGVLIFSKTNSLYSIGIIATIGILAITFLLIFLKRSSDEY